MPAHVHPPFLMGQGFIGSASSAIVWARVYRHNTAYLMVLISLRISTQNVGQQDLVTQWHSLRLLGCGQACPSGISKPTRVAPSWFWSQGREKMEWDNTLEPNTPFPQMTGCPSCQAYRAVWRQTGSQVVTKQCDAVQEAVKTRCFLFPALSLSDPEMKPVAWLPSQAPQLTGRPGVSTPYLS